jgi:hypothetical protein
VVTIRSRDGHLAVQLRGIVESSDPEAKGVSIASVQRVDKPRKSTVILRKGAETAKVEFAEANTTSAPPQAGGAGNRGTQVSMGARVGQTPALPGGGPRTNFNPNPGMNPMGGPQPTINPGLTPPNGDLGPRRVMQPGMIPMGSPLGAGAAAGQDASPKRRVRVIPNPDEAR